MKKLDVSFEKEETQPKSEEEEEEEGVGEENPESEAPTSEDECVEETAEDMGETLNEPRVGVQGEDPSQIPEIAGGTELVEEFGNMHISGDQVPEGPSTLPPCDSTSDLKNILLQCFAPIYLVWVDPLSFWMDTSSS